MNQASRPKPIWGAYLVGAYLFSVPAFGYSESLGLLIVPQIIGGLLVAYALVDMLGNLRMSIPQEIQLYGLFVIWAVVTFGLGESTSEWRALGTLLKVAAGTLASAHLIKDENDLSIALKIFVFSVLLVFYQNRYDLQYLRLAGQIAETERFAGTLANANNAAIYSLTVIWASIFLFLRSAKSLFRWIWLFIPVSISLMIIYYSGSKKGLIGIGLFVVFLARLLYTRQQSSIYKKGLIILASVSLIIVAGYFIYTSPFFFRIEEMLYGGSGSDINRLNLAREAIHVWLMNVKTFVMGVGYDNFRIFSDYQTYAHSTPLELLASNGIVGFSLFMGFLFVLFRKFINLYKYTSDQELKVIFFSTLIFLSIYSFFMLAAVMQDSREIQPILGGLAAFGQYHLWLMRQGRVNQISASVSGDAVV